eukprot:SAG31_NODE_3576_length_4107_cov_4.203593_6_plen_58_part_00
MASSIESRDSPYIVDEDVLAAAASITVGASCDVVRRPRFWAVTVTGCDAAPVLVEWL